MVAPAAMWWDATVRGADEQTVTAVKNISAAPAFILGIKLGRFLKDTLIVNPEVLVLDHAAEPLEGLEFDLPAAAPSVALVSQGERFHDGARRSM